MALGFRAAQNVGFRPRADILHQTFATAKSLKLVPICVA
jgi:hypothetical protein